MMDICEYVIERNNNYQGKFYEVWSKFGSKQNKNSVFLKLPNMCYPIYIQFILFLYFVSFLIF